MGRRKKYQIEGITFNELVEIVLKKAASNNNKISQDYLTNISSKYKLDNKTYEELVDLLLENNVHIENDFFGLLEKEETQEISKDEKTFEISKEKEVLQAPYNEKKDMDYFKENKKQDISCNKKPDINLMMELDKYEFFSYLSQSLPNHEKESKKLVDEYKQLYANKEIENYQYIQTLNCTHVDFYLPITFTYLSKKELLDELKEKYTDFFIEMEDFVSSSWKKEKNKNTCLIIYFVAYFEALAHLYNINSLCSKLLKENLQYESYSDFVDSLYRYYENTSMKYDWDTYYDFNAYDFLINMCKSTDLNFCIDESKYAKGISEFMICEEANETESNIDTQKQASMLKTEKVLGSLSDDEFNVSLQKDDNVVDELESNNQIEFSKDDSNNEDQLNNEAFTEEVKPEESDSLINEKNIDTDVTKIEQNESVKDDVLCKETISGENEISIGDNFVDTKDESSVLVEENKSSVSEESIDGDLPKVTETNKESDNMDEDTAITEYIQTNGYDNSWIDVILESDKLTFKNDLYVGFNLTYQTDIGTVLEDISAYVTTSNGIVVKPYEFVDELGPIPEQIDIHFNNKVYNFQFSPLFSLPRNSDFLTNDFTFNVSFKDVMRGYKVRITYILENDKWKTKEVFAYQSR